jgi:hypothetical protein
VRFGERPLARLAQTPSLAPPQKRHPPSDRQVSDPHHRPILDRQRCSATPAAARHLDKQLDLDLELPADFDHVRHDHTIDPDKTANVIPHSLFPLVRVFDNAKPARSSGCLRYPSLNPARLARPYELTRGRVEPAGSIKALAARRPAAAALPSMHE